MRISEIRMLGWALGAAASFLGIFLSYHFDLPTGATIVCVFGSMLALGQTLCRVFLD